MQHNIQCLLNWERALNATNVINFYQFFDTTLEPEETPKLSN